MKKFEIRVNQIGGKGGPQTVVIEAHDSNSARRQAEHLYGRGNVTNVKQV